MSQLECPHCGKAAISLMRKMFLGPAVAATCRECLKKVGVPWVAMLALIPFMAAVVLSAVIEPFSLKAVVWAAGFVVGSVIHIRWVPLERR